MSRGSWASRRASARGATGGAARPAGVARLAARLALAAALAAAGAWVAPPGVAAMGLRSGSGPAQPAPGQDDHVPGEVLVQFQEGVTPAARDALLRRLGMRVKRSMGGQNSYVVSILDGSSVAEAIAKLMAQPEVRHAEPNRIIRLQPRPGAQGAPATPHPQTDP